MRLEYENKLFQWNLTGSCALSSFTTPCHISAILQRLGRNASHLKFKARMYLPTPHTQNLCPPHRTASPLRWSVLGGSLFSVRIKHSAQEHSVIRLQVFWQVVYATSTARQAGSILPFNFVTEEVRFGYSGIWRCVAGCSPTFRRNVLLSSSRVESDDLIFLLSYMMKAIRSF